MSSLEILVEAWRLGYNDGHRDALEQLDREVGEDDSSNVIRVDFQRIAARRSGIN